MYLYPQFREQLNDWDFDFQGRDQAKDLSKRDKTLFLGDFHISGRYESLGRKGRNIVYLDETWLNTNHVVKGDWIDHPSTSISVFEPPCKGCGRVIPSGKGTR